MRNHPRAATFGGWQPRPLEPAGVGRVWSSCGADSEHNRLVRVLLAIPGLGGDLGTEPDALLMLDRPDLASMGSQHRSLAEAFVTAGVDVATCRPRRPLANFLFVRDLFLMTPAGAVVGRPAPAVRAGEEREIARVLAELGVPILRTIVGNATFEGADALWLRSNLVAVGVGQRTNIDGFRQLAGTLGELGVDCVSVGLSNGEQHLLGTVGIIDTDLAITIRDRTPERLAELLGASGREVVAVDGDDEILALRGLNFVTVAPRRVVMSAGCDRLRALLADLGVEAQEVDISEYLKAAGGIACATGVLHRALTTDLGNPS